MHCIYLNGQQYNRKAFSINMMYAIEKFQKNCFLQKKVQIRTDGLFINIDLGFDSKNLHLVCNKWGIIPNVWRNKR